VISRKSACQRCGEPQVFAFFHYRTLRPLARSLFMWPRLHRLRGRTPRLPRRSSPVSQPTPSQRPPHPFESVRWPLCSRKVMGGARSRGKRAPRLLHATARLRHSEWSVQQILDWNPVRIWRIRHRRRIPGRWAERLQRRPSHRRAADQWSSGYVEYRTHRR
jgi:hypothetical protein